MKIQFNMNKSLSLRIAVYVLSFCMLLFLLVLLVFFFFSRKQIEEMTLKNAEIITSKSAMDVERTILPIIRVAQNYKWILENKQQSSAELYEMTRQVVENNPDVIGSAIAFEPNFFEKEGLYFSPYSYRENDSIKSMQLGNASYDYFYMDWYQIPVATGKSGWSEPYHDTGGGNSLMTTYSVPFYKNVNNEKKIAGVITFDLSLNKFTDSVSSLKILETGYATVLSANGTFVTHPKKELIMNQTIFSYASEINNPELREIGRIIQKENSGYVSSTLNGVERMLYFKKLSSSNWSIAVVFPKSEMYLPLHKISIILIVLVCIGLLLLAVIVSKIISRQIIPLRHFAGSAREIAKGNFSNQLPLIKRNDELKDLHNSFEYMQRKLTQYIEDLKQTAIAKEKIESELRIAREIQMGMIPKIFPPFPNLIEIDLYATLHPAKEVGGDLYDFFMLDENHICFAIGDVSGKGVPASLFMAVTRTLLRSVAPDQMTTRGIVNSLNKSLSTNNDSNMFVTFFLGIIELNTGIMTYTNAGHNPPVLIHPNGEVKAFEMTKDIPVGVFETFEYEEKTLRLSDNDKLFLYTDGVTEAENKEEEFYSEKRLITMLSKNYSLTPKDLISVVSGDVALHVNENEQSDDITMLSIVYYGSKR
ncbi:MAG: SpoIIE family protein phosphatase [Bacteroidales bacterium]|nr:SpoIIE family protein phosphatase [Bacteroidales bacterium]